MINDQKKVFIFIGTTAELIKLIPVIKECKKRKILFTIIASRQNDIQFSEFKEITKDIQIILAVTPKSKKSSVFGFVIWAVRTFFSLLIGMRSNFKGLTKKNSYFIVHGDTISSLMGSLVASMYGLKLVHIESGLRSFNFFEPFPEEICRYIVSRLADIHFCPNSWAMRNLRFVRGEKINTRQNTLIETYWEAMKVKSRHPLVKQFIQAKRKYFVLVIHRQEHVLFGKRETTKVLKYLLNLIPKNLDCVFLVHDLSADFIFKLGKFVPKNVLKRMIQVERLPYRDFMHLLNGSEFMVTDGGSNQEELYYMGKPCLLLRNYTERTEGLAKNVVLGKKSKKLIGGFIKDYNHYATAAVRVGIPPSLIIGDYLFDAKR